MKNIMRIVGVPVHTVVLTLYAHEQASLEKRYIDRASISKFLGGNEVTSYRAVKLCVELGYFGATRQFQKSSGRVANSNRNFYYLTEKGERCLTAFREVVQDGFRAAAKKQRN